MNPFEIEYMQECKKSILKALKDKGIIKPENEQRTATEISRTLLAKEIDDYLKRNS